MPDKLKVNEERLADTKVQLENAKAEVERPFPQEEELSQKMERLAELNALLDMDHKENEIVDGDVKKVITNDEEYLCKYIIIATGRESKKIGLENYSI